jgi:HEAT repeats
MTPMTMTTADVADSVEEALVSDEDRRWELIARLQVRGDEAALHQATRLSRDADPARRKLAADILAQLRVDDTQHRVDDAQLRVDDTQHRVDDAQLRVDDTQHRVDDAQLRVDDAELRVDDAAREQVVATLLTMATRDSEEPAVLESIAYAFGHVRDARSVPFLVRLRDHSSAEVREAVTFGLLGRPERDALETLVLLSADTDPTVRDWATFGLARQTDTDTPEIRTALAARLDDEPHVRLEAIAGLAARRDDRAVEPLIAVMAADVFDGDRDILVQALHDTAARTGNPRLQSLLARWDD